MLGGVFLLRTSSLCGWGRYSESTSEKGVAHSPGMSPGACSPCWDPRLLLSSSLWWEGNGHCDWTLHLIQKKWSQRRRSGRWGPRAPQTLRKEKGERNEFHYYYLNAAVHRNREIFIKWPRFFSKRMFWKLKWKCWVCLVHQWLVVKAVNQHFNKKNERLRLEIKEKKLKQMDLPGGKEIVINK